MSDATPADPEARLEQLGIALPAPPAPAAAYVPVRHTGDLVYTAGQVAAAEGQMVATGRLGLEVDLETGQACARQCAVNVLAQLKADLGDLDRVRRFVKITVFVASEPTFDQQHLVANGASELFVQVFGDDGRHARSAVGVPVLPLGSPVEVEAIVEVS